MFRLLVCVLAAASSLTFAHVAAAQDEAQADIKEVEKLTANLLEVQKLSRALDICRRVLKKNPDQIHVQATACRICWLIGVQLESEERAKETFEIGFKLAEKMRQRHPDKPDGWYWYAVNYGQFIERSSIFAKIGAAGKLTQHAKKTLELDPSYDWGGAYLMVGRINQLLPGGDDAVAEEYFKKAIAIAPRRTTGHLYLGELYHDQKKYAEAKRELQAVFNAPNDPQFAVERKLDMPRARELMADIDEELGSN